VTRDASTRDAAGTDASVADASPPDTTAPVFAGVQSVTLVDSTRFNLTWNPANDDRSGNHTITYRVYVSTSPGAPARSTLPTLATIPDVGGTVVSGLVSRTTYYVVVHAVDEAGNEDTNDVELAVQTLTSFALDVQPIFTASCVLPSCHTPGNPPQGLILLEGYAYAGLVDKVAGSSVYLGQPGLKRVDSTTPDLEKSYLWLSLQDRDGGHFAQMPPPSVGALDEDKRQIIADWIRQGAREN
jgi:hypothetical protein